MWARSEEGAARICDRTLRELANAGIGPGPNGPLRSLYSHVATTAGYGLRSMTPVRWAFAP
ncbi:hypothetical protein S7711_10415 [Stachybotrys chartarum IBT 7711]|uniref:Uncharacterized protein n=1 Tax=Stachybotrys chartarum (strain CBS 109288 / IBT 7711) TaxID=1280523 RepID=A0A084B4A7_STACB|nr:hypothetical protein S7711_10415 [Stachybotrys chartarum IBT 7711]